MLNLTLDSAVYCETDFARFNPEGFRQVRAAVELAQMKRTIGMSLEDMHDASKALEAAIERKNAEQRVAMERFERERQKCFDALRGLTDRIMRSGCERLRRSQIENCRDHLVTLFGLKDFGAVRREMPKLEELMRAAEASAQRGVSEIMPSPSGESASSHYYRGQALERSNRRADAVEAYNRALAIDSRHVQAKVALARLVGRTSAAGRGGYR